MSQELLLRQINADRALGSALLFAHRHKQASPEFHIHIMDMWRSIDPLVVIEAFREGAKTTLSEEFLLMEAAFGNFSYALIFGETYTKACQRIEAIKHEILTNDKLKVIFGPLKGTLWSENRIQLTNGSLIEAHGWEEEIRGYKYRDMRPDRAYLDDIESKSSVRDTATVDANWKKIHLELIPAMDKTLGRIRMTGTPLADDCLIRRAAGSPNWVSGRFPLADRDIDDPNAQSLWPERYPMEWIRTKKAQYSREGMLREFMQEYMLVASGSQGKPFTEDMITSCDLPPSTYAPRTVIIDPARTVEVKKSDQTGYVVVSKIGTTFYVHQSAAEYWQPDEIVAGAFNLSEAHDHARVVIEKNSLDDWLLQPIRAMGLMTGHPLDFKAVNAPQDRDKAAFIMGLRPFFKAGDIIFVGGRAKHQQLVSQLLNFPSGKRDIINALAYVLRVYSGTPVYPEFGEANIADNLEPGRDDELLLGCNATHSETSVVLVASSGRSLSILADWVSPLMPSDSIPDIITLIKAVYPTRRLTAWVPGEVFDQVGRNPLIAALKAAKLQPRRGENSIMCRQSLSPLIRTEMRGRRMLLCDRNAHNTLTAMTGGYNYQVKSGGERHADPEAGQSRTLLEGLETLNYALNHPDTTSILKTNALNSLGTPYVSALPRR